MPALEASVWLRRAVVRATLRLLMVDFDVKAHRRVFLLRVIMQHRNGGRHSSGAGA